MERNKVGIITLHCADNYGAMLQAYGLKQYLCGIGIKTDIVPYEPPFMTGRHWWIPYVPVAGFRGHIWSIWHAWDGWRRNLQMGTAFFTRRKKMGSFRRKYLVDRTQKKLIFLRQFRRLSYRYYIVGSDQIWNPAITRGFRRAYFGAFKNKKKEKVIAYAASIGSASLEPECNRTFSRLLSLVDVISVREKETLPYVQELCGKKVTVLPDPVLLLDKEDWQQIECPPGREGYILAYITEKNEGMMAYVKKLSEHKKLPVIELRINAGRSDKDFSVDYTAGPAEFLGYIHHAAYVVTNAFHGTAFSIIFRKKFVAFQHSKLSARINNILRMHKLEHRLYKENSVPEIDDVIDWETVKQCTAKHVKTAKEFLVKYAGI